MDVEITALASPYCGLLERVATAATALATPVICCYRPAQAKEIPKQLMQQENILTGVTTAAGTAGEYLDICVTTAASVVEEYLDRCDYSSKCSRRMS